MRIIELDKCIPYSIEGEEGLTLVSYVQLPGLKIQETLRMVKKEWAFQGLR